MRARTFVSVAVCVSRKVRPCPSYIGRRDHNNSVHWRSLYKGGGVVHIAPWKKLRTGERQRDGKPLEIHCPIDHSLETITHSIHECKFIKHAFKIIQDCFKVDISHVFCTDTLATLTTPAGVVAWSAVHVNWIIRCAIKKTANHGPAMDCLFDQVVLIPG